MLYVQGILAHVDAYLEKGTTGAMVWQAHDFI